MRAVYGLFATVWARTITNVDKCFVSLIPEGSSSNISDYICFMLAKAIKYSCNNGRVNFIDVTMISALDVNSAVSSTNSNIKDCFSYSGLLGFT